MRVTDIPIVDDFTATIFRITKIVDVGELRPVRVEIWKGNKLYEIMETLQYGYIVTHVRQLEGRTREVSTAFLAALAFIIDHG